MLPISPGSTSIATTTATAIGTGCTIDFAGSPVSGHAPLAITFTSLPSCEVDRRHYNFGDGGIDGKTIGNQNETNACDRAGTYTVSLYEAETGEWSVSGEAGRLNHRDGRIDCRSRAEQVGAE